MYSSFESVFEFLQDPYFVTRDFTLSDQVFKLGNIVVNFVAFHFETIEFISGLFHLPSMGEGEFERSFEVIPEAFRGFGNLVIILSHYHLEDADLVYDPVFNMRSVD